MRISNQSKLYIYKVDPCRVYIYNLNNIKKGIAISISNKYFNYVLIMGRVKFTRPGF